MKFVGQLLGEHLQRYPQMTLADIYKLLHQAAMGPGHAVQDADAARARLANEVSELSAGPADPLIEVISPDARLARVNLRPYLASGRDPASLATAFIGTAATVQDSPDKLAKFCACLGDLADAGGIPFTRAQVVAYFEPIAAQGYPVVHHSDVYRSAYRPAYRVVALALVPGLS